MNTIKLIAIINLLFIFSCSAQVKNSTKDTQNGFIIGNYMILPEQKEIRIKTRIGGKNWDGYTYQKDSKIDYTTTTMLIIGDQIFFKEYFPYSFNLDKLRNITQGLCKDDKNIYYTYTNIKSTKIDISRYRSVNDFIYKSEDGKLFFLDIVRYKLTPVEIEIDENSIKHLAGNYYYDKNGLYFLGGHNKKNERGYYDTYVEKSEKLVDARNVVPIVSRKYIVFNNRFFGLDGSNINELEIDTRKIIEVMERTNSFITDGKTMYSDLNYGYEENERNEKGVYGVLYPTLFSGVNLQKIYSPLLHFIKENNSVVINRNNPNHFPGLIAKIDNENYLLSDKKKNKIKEILFYHSENKTSEVFDDKYLKIYEAERFIQYKNVLYFEGIPVETSKLDMKNLREIANTDYLTDGKAIVYIGNITGYRSAEKNGIEYVILDDRIIENVYTKEMKPISKDLLSDGITIISKTQKANIKSLNLDVKIVK